MIKERLTFYQRWRGGSKVDTTKANCKEVAHQLESAEEERGQDGERMRASAEGHSHPGEPRHRDKSGHGNNVSQQGVLTSWRAQTQRQVRTRKECGPAEGTHKLESTDTKMSQDMERM